MPLFEYRCESGHEREELQAESAESMPCGCGLTAFLKLSIPGRGKVVGGTNGGQDAESAPKADALTTIEEIGPNTRMVTVGQRGFKVQNYKCATCGKPGMDVFRRDCEPVVPECCDSPMAPVVGSADIDWFSKAASGSIHGIYDRSAGRWFESKAERTAWMKSNGMVDANDVDYDAITRIRSVRERAEDEYANKVMDGYDRDPALRQMRDEGRIRDWEPFRPTRRA